MPLGLLDDEGLAAVGRDGVVAVHVLLPALHADPGLEGDGLAVCPVDDADAVDALDALDDVHPPLDLDGLGAVGGGRRGDGGAAEVEVVLTQLLVHASRRLKWDGKQFFTI